MKNIFFFITILLLKLNSVGQTIDSLKLVLKNAKHDTTRFNTLFKISEEYYKSSPDSVISICNKIIYNIEKNTNNSSAKLKYSYLKIKAKALYNIGVVYKDKGKNDLALASFEKSLKIRDETNDKEGQADSYNQFGIFYNSLGNNTKALEFYEKSISIYGEIGNKKGLAEALNNIGLFFKNNGNIIKALDCYGKSLRLKEELNDIEGEAVCLNNMGQIYKLQGDNIKAIAYLKKSLKIYEKVKNKKGTAYLLNNIGLIYMQKKEYSSALDNFNKSAIIFKEIQSKKGLAACFNNIGSVYKNQDSINSALNYSLKSLMLNKELDDKKGLANSFQGISSIYFQEAQLSISKNKSNEILNIAARYADSSLFISKQKGYILEIINAESILAKIDSAKGDYRSAYLHYQKFITYRDSINSEAARKASQNSQLKYEYEKKAITDSINYLKETEIKNAEFILLEKEKSIEIENLNQLKLIDELTIKNKNGEIIKKNIETKNNQQQIKGLEKEKILSDENIKQQKFIQKLILSSLALLLVFSGFIFMGFRKTRKANKIIAQQKNEVEKQKHLVEEKHKEITDSINYAERIQRSFLATKEILDENLNDYFVLFKPKDVVSGDFYWASILNNGNFALVTADSTGHGVPGAIMSLLNITSLEKAVEHINNPNEILNHTRTTIITRLKKDGSEHGGKDGMDASLIVFDFKQKQLHIAAANNPVWIVRENTLIEIKPDKMPIGKHDKDSTNFTQQTIDLQTDDVIYSITDGYPDQFGGEKGKKFMSKNLKELLLANSHLPMDEQKILLDTTFKNWVGDLEQVDDVTVIGIRV